MNGGARLADNDVLWGRGHGRWRGSESGPITFADDISSAHSNLIGLTINKTSDSLGQIHVGGKGLPNITNLFVFNIVLIDSLTTVIGWCSPVNNDLLVTMSQVKTCDSRRSDEQRLGAADNRLVTSACSVDRSNSGTDLTVLNKVPGSARKNTHRDIARSGGLSHHVAVGRRAVVDAINVLNDNLVACDSRATSVTSAP